MVVGFAEEDGNGQAEALKLQALYTEHVIPNELLALWNNGLHRLSHIVLAGEDPVAERPRIVAMFVKRLVTNLLHVDSSPTLSRFFTFRNCTDRMHTMMVLGLPPQAFKLRSVKPRQENQKRLRNVHKFFNHTEAI